MGRHDAPYIEDEKAATPEWGAEKHRRAGLDGRKVVLNIDGSWHDLRVDFTRVGDAGVRIFFDAFWWRAGPPSGRNVVTSIVLEWVRAFPMDELTLGLPRRDLKAEALVPNLPTGVSTFGLKLPQHGLSSTFEMGALRGFDVVFTQNFTPVWSRALRATFLHDVLFQEHPEWFTKSERRYLAPIPHLAERADLVLTSSLAECDRIGRLNPQLRGTTHAVGLGLATEFAQAKPRAPEGGLRPGHFLLTVGRLNIRKNVDVLVEALRSDGLITPNFPLVVVGEPDGASVTSAITEAAIVEGSVIRSGYVPNDSLRWMYESCASFVLPSFDEGFGLPVLEAASAGAPMALSRIAPFAEFGDVAVFFDPADPTDMARAVREVLAGKAPSSRALSERYAWSITVGAMRALISDSLREKRRRS